jgi:pimeloyl-ACP methyl ester carboxylesterase
LPSIEVPLLVIQGEDDTYGARGQVIPSHGLARPEYVTHCGHTPHREAQAVVLQLMSEFVAHILQTVD